MLQAGRYSADIEILFKHLKPDTRISTNVIAILSNIKLRDAHLMMRSLLIREVH